VIQNVQVGMYGFVDASLGINATDANDTDRTAWSFANLAFRLEMTGAINLFTTTDGMPDLAAAQGSGLEIGLRKHHPAAISSCTLFTLVGSVT